MTFLYFFIFSVLFCLLFLLFYYYYYSLNIRSYRYLKKNICKVFSSNYLKYSLLFTLFCLPTAVLLSYHKYYHSIYVF